MKFFTNLKNAENEVEKIINKIINKQKIKNTLKDFLHKSAQEIDEYKEMGIILKKFMLTGKITKEESKKVYTQLIDTLKISGCTGIWFIPGGSLLLILLIKLAKKWNINLLPTSFKK